MHEQETKRAAITYLVESVYIPQMIVQLSKFLAEYAKEYQSAHALAKLFNRDVPMEVIKLDLKAVNQQLIDNLVQCNLVTTNETPKTEKSISEYQGKDLFKEESARGYPVRLL